MNSISGCPVPHDVSTLYNPMTPPHVGNPFPSYRWMRENSPVHFVDLLGMWIVTRHEDALEVANDNTRFSSEQNFPWLNDWLSAGSPELSAALTGAVPQGHFILSEDPPRHTRLRAIANKAFAGPRVNAMRPLMREIAENLINAHLATGRLELVGEFADPYISGVLSALMGVPAADFAQVRSWAEDMLALLNPVLPPEHKVDPASRWPEFDEYIMRMINARRTDPQDDLLSEAIHQTDPDGESMSDEDLVFLFRGNYVGGVHSGRIAISNAVRSMLTEPEHWAAAQTDPAVIPRMFEESLRRDAPIRGLPRTTLTDVEVGGVSIPAGSRILVLYDAANRDDRVFDNPDTFAPERQNVRQHVAFGYGTHLCVGAHLARTEGRTALETLTRLLPQARIADDFEAEFRPDFFFRGLDRLDLEWPTTPTE